MSDEKKTSTNEDSFSTSKHQTHSIHSILGLWKMIFKWSTNLHNKYLPSFVYFDYLLYRVYLQF